MPQAYAGAATASECMQVPLVCGESKVCPCARLSAPIDTTHTFLALSLPFLSHLSFPSILVVGPHRSLLSPGPVVTIKEACFLLCAEGRKEEDT